MKKDSAPSENTKKDLWPVMALLAGLDDGLRVGGPCTVSPTHANAHVLGVIKNHPNAVKVQYDEGEVNLTSVYYSRGCTV